MSQRYQREIEEILQQAGDLSTSHGQGGSPPATKVPRSRPESPGFIAQVWQHIKSSVRGGPAGKVMLGAILVLLAALVMNAMAPGLGLVGPLAWGGLILFIVGYAMFFIKPKKVEQRWRGQPLESEEKDSWTDWMKRRMK